MSLTQPSISQMVCTALLGQAAIVGAYVPVPFLVQSVGQSMMIGDSAKRIKISTDMLDFLRAEVSPADPTRVFEGYLFDWWSGPGATGLVSGDGIEEAYKLHIKKVVLNTSDNCSGSSVSSMGHK